MLEVGIQTWVTQGSNPPLYPLYMCIRRQVMALISILEHPGAVIHKFAEAGQTHHLINSFFLCPTPQQVTLRLPT